MDQLNKPMVVTECQEDSILGDPEDYFFQIKPRSLTSVCISVGFDSVKKTRICRDQSPDNSN